MWGFEVRWCRYKSHWSCLKLSRRCLKSENVFSPSLRALALPVDDRLSPFVAVSDAAGITGLSCRLDTLLRSPSGAREVRFDIRVSCLLESLS